MGFHWCSATQRRITDIFDRGLVIFLIGRPPILWGNVCQQNPHCFLCFQLIYVYVDPNLTEARSLSNSASDFSKPTCFAICKVRAFGAIAFPNLNFPGPLVSCSLTSDPKGSREYSFRP